VTDAPLSPGRHGWERRGRDGGEPRKARGDLPPLLTADELAALDFAARVLQVHADDVNMGDRVRETYAVEARRLVGLRRRSKELWQ
jgi:hypothetical protein